MVPGSDSWLDHLNFYFSLLHWIFFALTCRPIFVKLYFSFKKPPILPIKNNIPYFIINHAHHLPQNPLQITGIPFRFMYLDGTYCCVSMGKCFNYYALWYNHKYIFQKKKMGNGSLFILKHMVFSNTLLSPLDVPA